MNKEPTYPALLNFGQIDGDGEYVVIATEGPINDHVIPGYKLYSVHELDSEPDCFPLNTPLMKA
jgi:hypothetical protein